MKIHKFCHLRNNLNLVYDKNGRFKLRIKSWTAWSQYHIVFTGQSIKAKNNALFNYAVTCKDDAELKHFIQSFKIRSGVKINSRTVTDKNLYYLMNPEEQGGRMFLQEASKQSELAAFMLVGATDTQPYLDKVRFVTGKVGVTHKHVLVFKGKWLHEGFVDSGFNRQAHLEPAVKPYQAYGHTTLSELIEEIKKDYEMVSEIVYNGKHITEKELAVLLIIHAKE